MLTLNKTRDIISYHLFLLQEIRIQVLFYTFLALKTFLYLRKKRKKLYNEGIHFGQIWPYGIVALMLKKMYGINYTIFIWRRGF